MSLIFLSHTEEDFPITGEIAHSLEEAGYSTWYYERDTLPGTSYLLQITRAIESCDAVVLIASSNSISSDQVTKEVIYAFEGSRALLPLLKDLTPDEMKQFQPEWRYALGGTAMITMAPEDLSQTITSIIEGLKALAIKPGKAEAPSAQVLSTSGIKASRTITDKVLSQRASLEGERKQVTVLSAEVAGLSAMDPEDHHELMGLLANLISQEVHHYEGTVAQVSGDSFTALFGAPIAHEDDPARALHAALSIREKLEKRPEKLSLKAGVNTGLLIVGAISDDLSMEYTAIGDTVDLASQLLETADSGEVLASEETYELSRGYFNLEPSEASASFRVLSPRKTVTRVEAAMEKGLSHFVGRQSELARLSECLDKAGQGQGQVVGIVGEPGVGKSRLVHEFTSSLPESDYTVLRGGCYHYGDAIPYLPVLEVLKDYFDINESDSEEATKEKVRERIATFEGQLDEAMPPFQEVLSLKVEDETHLALAAQQRRQRVFEAIRLLLVIESQRRPLVLVVEDLHWIDKTSEEFLGFLIDSLGSRPILLILLYRPEYTSSWTSKTYYNQMSLDQLPERTSAELIFSILSEGEVDRGIVELIVTRASGNPLFIEELTHGLLENGSIVKDNSHYALSEKPSELEVPDTVQGIIAARLDRLEENLKRIMQVASVIGREFAFRLLAAITKAQEELKSYLSSLQGLEFIYEKSLFPELEYIFKHALTQEVAYNSLLKKKRKELHGSIGQAIENLYPNRLEEFYEILAYHYARSEDAEKAIQYLKLSGDKAVRNYSNWEAVSFYKEALKILDAQPETVDRKRKKIELCLSTWRPVALLNYPEVGIEILEEAERLSQELDDDRNLIRVHRRIALYHSTVGNVQLGLEYCEKCLDAAERIGAVDSMAQTANMVCNVYINAGYVLQVVETTRRTLQLLEEQHREKDLFAGGFNTYSELTGYCGASLGLMGELEEAMVVYDKGVKNALEINDTWGLGWIEYCFVALFYYLGDGDATIEHARTAIECFEETGIEILLGDVRSFLGAGYYLLGDYKTASDHAEAGLKLQKERGLPFLLPVTHWHLAMIHLSLGDIERALRCGKESLRLAQKYETRLFETGAWIMLGRVVGEAGASQAEVAGEHIQKGLALSEELKLRLVTAQGYLFLGEVLEIAGRKEEAVESLKAAEKMDQELGMGYWLDRTREALARLEA